MPPNDVATRHRMPDEPSGGARWLHRKLSIATLAFAVVNIFIWFLWWNKPLDVQRQIVVGPSELPDALPIRPVPWGNRLSSAIVGNGASYEYDPLSSTSVSSFWSISGEELNNIQDLLLFAIEALVGTVFGAIHCAAWNADFPTAVERWMWRSCSLLIAAIPAVILLFLVLSFIVKSDRGEEMVGIGLVASIPIYVIARLVLIILPLVALRSLPSGALMDVNWSVYILHL
ncbi:hypothetical protein B0H13DRAFT_2485104 [Mycena leptocephala]|nr:hypothetical protein B0H13DRAFT_2485104 [Mycena leptocephala]